MIQSLVIFGGMIWFLWKFFCDKNLRHLFIAIFLAALILTQWPVYLSYKFSFALWALMAAGFMIYEVSYKKEEKQRKRSPLTYIYILLFIAFGLLFLGEALLNSKLSA